MSNRMKFAAVLGALSMLLVASPAQAKARSFALSASQGTYNVTCAPGATHGTSSIKIKVIVGGLGRITKLELGNDNGRANRYIASWDGGQISLNARGRFFPAQANLSFPCPPTSAAPVPFKITVQGYRFNVAVGTPAIYWMLLFRVGSPS
jgi:hypothetical protein